ncbi:glycerate kinase [Raineyella antarctica]|uniref:Glycerate kinase n=1 Tax=Raineyella antarctica TaxID=1577474 RepID=A0A1G6HDH4_9ACTN|nr:glycerate kinase [Raineyella antarctica]SDB91975.1 glycerate kinase [Raineyella antarctica]
MGMETKGPAVGPAVRVVLAPDSFKESMTAAQATEAMAAGVLAADPGATCVRIPMSDGGEGFAEAIGTALGAERVPVAVRDARGRAAQATLMRSGDLAVIDVASAVGLAMVEPTGRDVMHSDSRGVGDLVRAALDGGARRLIIGLGGSATNDGGAGMLVALGAVLTDADGRELPPTPEGLRRLARIDLSGLDPRLARLQVQAACDVTNPLLGELGASAVFGPQKGASEVLVRELDAILSGFVRLSPEPVRSLAAAPGAGAAGGLGWALMGYLGALTRPGVELLAETVDLPAAVAGASLVLTGEGSVDAQTLSGKTVAGVAGICAGAGVPCIVFAGRLGPGSEVLLGRGVTALLPILPEPADLPVALREGPRNLHRATTAAMRIFLAGRASGSSA